MPLRFLTCGAMLVLLTLTAHAQRPRGTDDAASAGGDAAWRRAVTESLWETLAGLERENDTEKATARATTAMHEVMTHGALDTDADLDLLVLAALTRRVSVQLAAVPPDQRLDLLRWLRGNERLAQEVAFLIHADEDPAQVYALLDRFRRERPEQAAAYPELAAAICVVHDRRLVQNVNENSAEAPDPIALFDYYVGNARKLNFDPGELTPRLLVHVVDAAASIDELEWALQRYRRNRQVGRTFFEIRYDTPHFEHGAPKTVNRMGWNLVNIRQYGGVCVDQAYFATTVGKAIGVPTAFATGASAQGGHAWVGFLEARGRNSWWNFDEGRYPEFQGVRGNVRDPQTRRTISDDQIAVLAMGIDLTDAERIRAEALIDASIRARVARVLGADVPDRTSAASAAPVRDFGIDVELAFMEQALRLHPGARRGWLAVQELALQDRMPLEQKRRWSNALLELCGTSYPDFTIGVLRPMLETIDDPAVENEIWNAVFPYCGKRRDLQADVRLTQAMLFREMGDDDRALEGCRVIVRDYVNDGPFVIRALQLAETILRERGDDRGIVDLYMFAWRAATRPGVHAVFAQSSNWYRLGQLVVARLEEFDRGREARTIRRQLEQYG